VPQFKLAPPFQAANRTQVCAAALAGVRARDGSCVDTLGHFDADPNNFHVQTANVQGNGIREDGQGAVLTLDWELPAVNFTSVSGYDQQDRQEFQDFDATPWVGTDNSFTQDISAFSQELRLSSKDSGWIAGVFYSTDEVDNLQVMRSEDLFNQPVPIWTHVDWRMQTESYAAFGQLEQPLSERFTGVVGVRYTHEKRTFEGGTVPLHALFPTVLVDNETSFEDVSGKVGLNFKPIDGVLLYASASKGFKSGGFGGGFATRAVAYDPYGPEELFAYEIGVKSEPFDTVRLNAAAYYYDWKDFQATVTRTDPLTNLPTQVLSNAGDARITGFETEINWRAALGLDVSLSANWSDPKIVSGIYEGRMIGNTPKFSGAGMIRYEHPASALGGSLFALADFNYRTRYPLRLVTATTRPLVYQDAFWLANARVGYKSTSEKVEISAWVRNVFEQEYLLEVFDQGTLNTLDLYAEPRTYGVSFTYNFF
jgi:iron complex outermembrane receptor protein